MKLEVFAKNNGNKNSVAILCLQFTKNELRYTRVSSAEIHVLLFLRDNSQLMRFLTKRKKIVPKDTNKLAIEYVTD